ncbi:MAG TPA: galactokinase [Chloroflexia bacterium]|nr:galactokinase [Chloroflexia bacterium]
MQQFKNGTGDAPLAEAQRAEQLSVAFADAFGTRPEFIARAPGRVNLIGEHTDYNGGFVLPAAIDRTVLIAVKSVPGSRQVEMVSGNYGNRASFDLDDIQPTHDKHLAWSNYVRAVAWALTTGGLVDAKAVKGAQMAIEGNVPTGSGLSSSAAVEVASALAFTRLAGAEIAGENLALACQRAENEFIGVKSGIMDQFISALGQPDSALLIDTRSLQYEVVPLGLESIEYRVVAADSAVPRSLITSAYNQRRAECDQAMIILRPLLGLPQGAQLRDVTLDQLEMHRTNLPDLLYKRARHVVSEDARTLQAANLMRAGLARGDNLHLFGQLLDASHASLRDDYEVSSRELDLLVELAQNTPGVAGARMTGAGFGGCTVNIVDARYLSNFQQQVVDEYSRSTGLDGKMYICRAVGGGSYLA